MNQTRKIRVISIGLFRHKDAILVFVDYDSKKHDAFCRPLGGGVEFGERAEAALVREIQEELGLEIEAPRLITILESFFSYDGQASHEIVFVFDSEFVDKSIYEKETLVGYEAEAVNSTFTARWMTLAQMEAEGVRLVPEDLRELLAHKLNSLSLK